MHALLGTLGQMTTASSDEPGLLEFAIVAFAILFAIGIQVLILYLLYDAQRAIPPEHRRIEPGQVWLLLIPLFNLVWNFFVFLRIPESYQSYFYSRGRYDVGDGGKSLGMWFSICTACSVIPCLGIIPAFIGLVLLIVFLVKITGLKGQVAQLAAMPEIAATAYATPGGFPVGYAPPVPFPPAPLQPGQVPPPTPPTHSTH